MMLQVLVCEKLAPLKEYYFAIIMDRAYKVLIIILTRMYMFHVDMIVRAQ